jgi:hypothetical protein
LTNQSMLMGATCKPGLHGFQRFQFGKDTPCLDRSLQLWLADTYGLEQEHFDAVKGLPVTEATGERWPDCTVAEVEAAWQIYENAVTADDYEFKGLPRVTASSLVKFSGDPRSTLHIQTTYPTYTSLETCPWFITAPPPSKHVRRSQALPYWLVHKAVSSLHVKVILTAVT